MLTPSIIIMYHAKCKYAKLLIDIHYNAFAFTIPSYIGSVALSAPRVQEWVRIILLRSLSPCFLTIHYSLTTIHRFSLIVVWSHFFCQYLLVMKIAVANWDRFMVHQTAEASKPNITIHR